MLESVIQYSRRIDAVIEITQQSLSTKHFSQLCFCLLVCYFQIYVGGQVVDGISDHQFSQISNMANNQSFESSLPNSERTFPIFYDSTVKFYLFVRNRTGSDEVMIGSSNSVRKSHYSPQLNVKILIHGYKRNGFSDFPHLVKNAYLDYGTEYNIICVDWKRLAANSIYLNSAYNTRFVGEKVAELIIFLKDEGFIAKFQDVHVIGFSLGAQVSGYVGKYILGRRNQKIGRITGLDPAGPGFTGPDSNNRLDMEDAEFVDVIHTSVKSGLAKAIGHVDFFPNGGEQQPGCVFENIVDPLLGGCSHQRSVALYVESIKGTLLYGCNCETWMHFDTKSCNCKDTESQVLMGEHTDPRVRGTFFLKTNSLPPYLHTSTNTSAIREMNTGFRRYFAKLKSSTVAT